MTDWTSGLKDCCIGIVDDNVTGLGRGDRRWKKHRMGGQGWLMREERCREGGG